MTVKTDIWMPLYIGDYLADTSRLTTEQHGAYFLLMMDYWRSGPPPDDDGVLASICKCSVEAWTKIRQALQGFFTVIDGFWTHARIEKERTKAKKNSAVKSESGKIGAQKKWQKHNEMMANAMANGMANAYQTDAPSPSPSKSSLDSKAVKPKATPQTTVASLPAKAEFLPPDWVPIPQWDAWIASRKKLKKAPTPEALSLAVKTLDKFRLSGHDPAEVLDASTLNGWAGLFEPKGGNRSAGQRQGVSKETEHEAGRMLFGENYVPE